MVDEVTLAIAAAVAGKVTEQVTQGARDAAATLRRKLRDRFRSDAEAEETLDNALAAQDPEDAAVAELARRLVPLRDSDPEVRELVEELRPHVAADGSGNVTNSVRGNVTGTVVQARDIGGGLSIG